MTKEQGFRIIFVRSAWLPDFDYSVFSTGYDQTIWESRGGREICDGIDEGRAMGRYRRIVFRRGL